MTLRWQDIKSFNNSQNNAFEELVCQLAREESIEGRKEFYRVAAPDGGVEAYCVLGNGDEYGWQAKYFSSMGTSQWNQVEDSFKTALSTHPRLKKYFICIPLDRQDPRREQQTWFMDRWNEKTKAWADYVKSQGRDIIFEYWGSSELIYRLSQEKHAGRKLFWFSQDDFSDSWFKSQVNTSIENLGKRYTPELNIELEIAKYFDAISKNDIYREAVKHKFHELILSINKAASSLSSLGVDNEIKEIKQSISDIEYQFALSQNKELSLIDINSLERGIDTIKRSLANCDDQTNKNVEKNDSRDYTKHHINEAWGAIYDFIDFIHSPILKLSNNPFALLSGTAGIGKSHLLADIALNRTNSNKSCILLLGQHFTSEEPPWTQILRSLLRLDCNEKQLLGALNAKAEAQGERLLFIIDAINEGRGKYFWRDHINGFVSAFKNYPWIGLILSIRSSYKELLIPKEILTNEKMTILRHNGFESIEYQASSFFFAQYGIEQPSVPLLNPEFSNPLFLRLFCEGLNRSNLTKIPKGYGGISSVIEFFINSINEKLSHPNYFDFPSTQNLIKKVVHKIIAYKLEQSLDHINYENAFEIADNTLSKYSSKRRFLDALISEGVLSKNLFWKENNEYEEGVYLTYERLDDHLTVSYLLDKYSEDDLQSLFKVGGGLYHYVEKSSASQGIVEAFAIQIPERTGYELYELIDDERKDNLNIINSFIYSLIWRDPGTIKDKTITYVNEHVLRYVESFDQFFQMVYSVALDPEHFYNADRLHKYLMQFSLPDRDSFWTTYIHNQDNRETSMFRLIDWAALDEDKSYLSDKSRLLAAKALAWIFTSTNISFRDSATKALIVLLENNIKIITSLLSEFEKVNDPYVYERIFAAAYGAVLRSDELGDIDTLSQYIVKTIFRAEEVYVNVLVRDYARNIVEFGIYKERFSLDDISIVRPPYKSSFPTTFPANEEIDAYRYDYNSKEFKDYYWGQNSILSSMVTEYGRGMCSYGDFGRYTFQSALHAWGDFDPNDLSNYACKIIFEEYGYDVEKHGKFDRRASSGDRHKNKTERIGKKYQWIALYEVLARISDNHKMIDESTRWGDDKQYVWFQGPWNPFVRNIDPTVIIRPLDNACSPITVKHKYSDWNYKNEEWLVRDSDLLNPEDIIPLTDSKAHEWIVLENDLSWEEPVPIGQDKYNYPRKHLWYQIRSYFVKEEDEAELLAYLNAQHFMGRWFPESHDRYQVFSREYYWSPAYQYFDKPYYGGYGWEDVLDENRDNVIAHVLPTAERHIWESGADYENQPSYLSPRRLMFLEMNLQYSNNIGEWLSETGEVIVLDLSVIDGGPSNLIVKKDALQRFLKENKLSIFWTCLGEKNIYGTSFSGMHFSQWLELSGVYTLKNGHIKGEIRPIIKGIQ
ncbi:P-loop NTPase family protein [Allochromatium vinosum]|uniref:ATP-binding protein n=1 Tax=Allochromatium vinosum (strain ATCC 17899 / DSM 180 / NBRC 103801 / NCIMB 10441 / D) TaxID=572477 RepID=D3RQH2_ALLVD|nr:hypothetical protein [Allochromatium vinosum]ADC61777.1 conserved hypothetical protein [Allochromatium vinosum DSM 180]